MGMEETYLELDPIITLWIDQAAAALNRPEKATWKD